MYKPPRLCLSKYFLIWGVAWVGDAGALVGEHLQHEHSTGAACVGFAEVERGRFDLCPHGKKHPSDVSLGHSGESHNEAAWP